MAVGKSFLDQYSVFCVFGSVVGCVVVPLITQSVESLIFSAIVISLTANRFSKKVVIEPSLKSESKEQKSIKGSKDIIPLCKKKKKPPSNSGSIQGNQNAIYHQLSPSQLRKQYQEEVERREYEKLRELERKEEEKREKKLKKKEERLKRKNNEKKETEVKQHTSSKQDKTSSNDKAGNSTSRSNGILNPKSDDAKRSSPPSSIASPPMNNVTARKSKYDYYRPNIPRFARQAAKQRQMGYHVSSPPTSPALSWNNNNNTTTTTTTTVNNIRSSSPDTTVIQPKVQSVIGCRKSPEPRESTPSPVSSEEKEHAGCYTLFGETQETNIVSIIRMEAGLENGGGSP